MEGYLGEFPVDLKTTEFKDFKAQDWALYFIERYGQYDGDHHKQWCIDQVARILKSTPVDVVIARWENGEFEYRVSTANPSQQYLAWVEEMKCWDADECEYIYDYDEGIAP